MVSASRLRPTDAPSAGNGPTGASSRATDGPPRARRRSVAASEGKVVAHGKHRTNRKAPDGGGSHAAACGDGAGPASRLDLRSQHRLPRLGRSAEPGLVGDLV